MGSNNVIQFPGQGHQGQRPSEEPKKKSADKQTSFRQVLNNKNFIFVLIIGFSLFAFNLKIDSSDSNSSSLASVSEGRGVASVQSTLQEDPSHQYDLARKLASVELRGFRPFSVGRKPSSDDLVRHGVLASKGYIFKRDLENGNVVSIELQADENNPAYLLNPDEFLQEHGDWLNKDFLTVEIDPSGEQVIGDRRLSHYILETKSGRKFKVTIERDLFQRLTSLSQTEVAENSFN